jgi:UPF0755 protein
MTFGTVLLVVFLVVAIKFLWTILMPMPGEQKLVYIDVPKHFSSYQVAKMLKENGLIRNTKYFQILMGLTRTSNRIKAGEYEFTSKMNMVEIFNILRKGKVKLREFTVPEGFTVKEIAELLEKNSLADAENFISTTRREDISKMYGIPVNNLEGYLYPDTYYLVKGMASEEIIDMMLKRFKSITADLEEQSKKA